MEGGAILACFRDTKPSNDFESTRLVARIIQFEYVYGACERAARAHPRSHRGSCNSRVYIQRVVLLAFSPLPLSPSRLRNRYYHQENLPTLLIAPRFASLRHAAPLRRFFIHLYILYPRYHSCLSHARSRIRREWIIGYRARLPGYFNLSLARARAIICARAMKIFL